MLAARHRLRRSDDFRRTVRRGARSSQPCVVVHELRSPAASAVVDRAPQVGFVVGSTVGNAVTRNTVARRLRHLMRERLDELPPGSTVVVRATPRAATASSARLGADLDACLAHLRRRQAQGRVPA